MQEGLGTRGWDGVKMEERTGVSEGIPRAGAGAGQFAAMGTRVERVPTFFVEAGRALKHPAA